MSRIELLALMASHIHSGRLARNSTGLPSEAKQWAVNDATSILEDIEKRQGVTYTTERAVSSDIRNK